MIRRLAALLLAVPVLLVPAPSLALSCVVPSYATPHDLISRQLSGYDEFSIPPFDLFLVGTVIHRGDLQGVEHGFGHRMLTVVVAGSFGDPLDSAVIEIASTKWLDEGESGGTESYKAMIPLWLQDDGLYHHGMCTYGPGTEGPYDPYEISAELSAIAESVGLHYQLFPASALVEATSPTTTVPTTTTIPVAIAPPPGPVDQPETVRVSPSDGRQAQTIARLVLAVLVAGGFGLVWRFRRQDLAKAAAAANNDDLTRDVRGL